MSRSRTKLAEAEEPTKIGSYFTAPSGHQFVSTGCTVLDCALGGGFPLGRIVNIVGDKSTAKTALATETITNFLRQYKGKAAYRDAEAAFDSVYADAMGMPVDQVDFGNPETPLETVEEFSRDLDAFLDQQLKAKEPGIYVLDSLDALSDENELSQDIGKGTYGTAKAKNMSIMFRKMKSKIERAKVLLVVVSQVRDNIGVMFGEKHKRSGGRALDFYASQIMWLSHLETLSKTEAKVKRPYGVRIKAKIKKNKIAFPFRECEFPFIFGYGIEDYIASVEWLLSVGKLKSEEAKALLSEDHDDNTYRAAQVQMAERVRKVWAEIETTFLPARKKYA